MSLWYSKQDYEAYQDLNETADDALFAITVLRNESLSESVYTETEIQEFLLEGAEIIDQILRATEEPQHVEKYHVAMANHLRSEKKRTPKRFKQELTKIAESMEESASDLKWVSGLNKAEAVLRSVEKFSAKNSMKSIEEMGGNFARVYR